MVFFFLYETLLPTGTYEMNIMLTVNCVDFILRMALLWLAIVGACAAAAGVGILFIR
jgi:hypothetical protein